MSYNAVKIENITLEFGNRFTDEGYQSPITCKHKLRDFIISAVIGSGIRYERAMQIANTLPEQPNEVEIVSAAALHRFPNQTIKRLSSIYSDDGKLLKFAIASLLSSTNVRLERKKFANSILGLGPKQSSFLYSLAGYGQNIAVLDRHILKYMHLIGILPILEFPNSWAKYEAIESLFLSYASKNQLPADALDSAIWITMKAAGRMKI